MAIEPTLSADPSERLAQLQRLRSSCTDAGIDKHAILVALLRQLPPADPALFSAVDEAPAEPAPGHPALLAAAWASAAAAQLQLATELAAGLDGEELGLEALAAEAEAPARPASQGHSGPGVVVIEEMETDEPDKAPASDLAITAVLAASLFGADARLHRPWAVAELAAAGQGLLEVLAGKLAAVVLASRPGAATSAAGQQQQQQPLLLEVVSMPPGRKGASQPSGQSEEVQQLLALTLPTAVARLHPVVAARVEHERHKTARLEPYKGPGSFERCVAAGQLGWLARQLSGRQLGAATSAVLPSVLAAIEDAFPWEQACGLWALEHLAAEGQAANLRPHARAVLCAVKTALAGAGEVSWPAAAAAAVAVVGRLEGGNPYAQPYHDVMTAMLDQASLGAHNPDRASAWLAAAPRLFPMLGLQLASHFARLMPLLLGWCLSPRAAVQAAALRTLLGVVRLTWPRMRSHAPLLWRVLRRVHGDEAARRALVAGMSSGAAAEEAAAAGPDATALAEDAGLALWCVGGTDFQVQLLTGKEGPSDALLQSVMQRVEAASGAVVSEASGGEDAPAGGMQAAEQQMAVTAV